jgi:hypothetical protein
MVKETAKAIWSAISVVLPWCWCEADHAARPQAPNGSLRGWPVLMAKFYLHN